MLNSDDRFPDLTLVVPCYKPQTGWGQRLASRFLYFCERLGPEMSIGLTLVHDGSPGGIDSEQLQVLREQVPQLQFIDLPQNRGKGYALRKGIEISQAKRYMYTDVDLPYTLDSMQRVAEALQAHGGVIAGERFEDYYAEVPLFRRMLSRTHRFLMRAMFRLPVSDSQAGLKGFDAQGRDIFLQTEVDRFLVDLDFLSRCRGKIEVRPVRVELRPDVQFTDFGLGILKAEAGNFYKIFRQSWS